MQFTRMPGPSSAAAARVSDSTPPLAAVYAPAPVTAISAATDEMFTMAPSPSIRGAECLIMRKVPRRLTAITRSQSSTDVSSSAPPNASPALLIRMSSGPGRLDGRPHRGLVG